MIHDSSERRLFLGYFAVFAVEILLLSFPGLPESMSFRQFAFCDHGSNLSIQYLISHGYRPTIDFSYPYGLLSALFGQLWLGAFGNTPTAYQAAMTMCDLLIVLAFARVAAGLRLGPFGIALMLVGMLFAVQRTFINFAHALEAVFICHALAEQAMGSKPRALALSATAVLAKPAMGYFYSLLLLILIGIKLPDRLSDRVRAWVRALAPAAIVFTGLLLLLALDFGIVPLIHTVFPIAGMANYGTHRYGFFTGKGHFFWEGDPTQGWLYYLRTPAGFWIFLTIYLVVAAIAALRKALSRSTFELLLKDEMVVTCAVLHVVFVTVLFGNKWSWVYYPYLLVLGVAPAVDISPGYRRFAVPLLLVGAISLISPLRTFEKRWTQEVRGRATAGLWAPPKVSDEWTHVLDLVRGHRATALYSLGGAQIMFPQFGPPVSSFLHPGLATPVEARRALADLAEARLAVVPLRAEAECFKAPALPQFKTTLKDFTPLWKGKYFEVLRRDPTRASQPRQ
jgi:hypothetical protein